MAINEEDIFVVLLLSFILFSRLALLSLSYSNERYWPYSTALHDVLLKQYAAGWLSDI